MQLPRVRLPGLPHGHPHHVLSRVRRVLLALAILLLVLPAQAAEIPNPFPGDQVFVTTLSNGLRVVVREDHSLPVLSAVVVVRGGAAAEGNRPGIAHVLEHMVLQGTARYPKPLEPQQVLEQVGGMSNGMTTRDMTRLEVVIASAHAELLVNVLAEIALRPLLGEASFHRERPVVLAEIQREADHPLAYSLNRAYLLAFRRHPYRFSPIGTIEDVLGMQPADLRGWYERWYVPNNMSIVFVGDITPAGAVQMVQTAFGQAKARPLPTGPSADGEVEEAHSYAHFQHDIPGAYVVLAFPAPSAREPHAMATFDVLTSLLCDGPDALLPAWWSKQGVSVGKFGIEFVSSRQPGCLLIWAHTTPEQVGKLHDATLTLMTQLAVSPIAPEQLARAKQRLLTGFLLDNETYSQQAATLAFYEGLGDVHLAMRYVPSVQAVTAEDLRTLIPTRPLGWVTVGQRPEALP